jgi:hypothetical protein
MLQVDEIGTVGERISRLINHFASGNKTAFGRAAGLQSGLLAGIIGTRQSKPSFEVLQKILTGYPTVNPTWLLFGRGEMLAEQKPTPTYEEEHPYIIPNSDGTISVAGLRYAPGAYVQDKERHEEKRKEMQRYERAVSVLSAFGEYFAKTDKSPELRGILDMLPTVLTPPLTIDQEDALWAEEHEKRMDAYHADQQAERERQPQEREQQGGQQ